MAGRKLEQAPGGDYWIGRFAAMASPCELLLEVTEHGKAKQLLDIAATEALRIEQKFSRYRNSNIIHRINHSDNLAIQIDDETARLLDYAAQLYKLSDGLFDITAGVLRRVWRFEPDAPFPSQSEIEQCRQHIGWHRVRWQAPTITLPAGMEIDLGGIGKEYAVDRTAALLSAVTDASFLINYGGDLFASGPRRDHQPWAIGVDDPDHTGRGYLGEIPLKQGGMATSGDARRFLMKDGVRYGHILNPKTGWPVEQAPHSVTTHAPTCMEAGMLATLAMLQGEGAEAFMQAQGLPFWLIR